jgi:hypothetical protein
MLGDGGDRDRAAYRLGPRDGKLHEANRRFHEKTRQIDRIADRHGLHEEKLEERRESLAPLSLDDHMKVMGASLDNGLLYVDVVHEVPEAAKPRTIKIGTTFETIVEEGRAP